MPPRHKDFFHYLAPHTDDRMWGVEPIAGGRTLIGSKQTYPPLGHPGGHAFSWTDGRTLSEFQVVLIASGSGTYRSHRVGEIPISAGDAFLLFPGEWHSYRPDPGRGWDERWLAFTGTAPKKLWDADIFNVKQPVIATQKDPAVVEAFDIAFDRLQREPPGFRAEISTCILTILARLAALIASSGVVSLHGNQMRALARRIQDDCPATLDVIRLAQEAGLSVAQFRRVFTQELGLSPKRYHQHIRLLRARHMLADHRVRIKDVAESMGFSSEFYFSRLFRLHIGQSPQEWRQRNPAN